MTNEDLKFRTYYYTKAQWSNEGMGGVAPLPDERNWELLSKEQQDAIWVAEAARIRASSEAYKIYRKSQKSNLVESSWAVLEPRY